MQKLKLCAAASALFTTLFISQASASIYFTDSTPIKGNGWSDAILLYEKYQNPNGKWGGYRIPGITTTSQGSVVAIADKRFDGISGNTDIVQGESTIHKVFFEVKASFDGGSTWSYSKFLIPNSSNYLENYTNYISDPQIVHNPDSGSTFVIGYQNNKGVGSADNSNDWSMWIWESKDGGRTWGEGHKIAGKTAPTQAVTLGTGYNKALQGPGAGMYYNNTIFVPIQQWTANKATSGFIYSTDNGRTWQQSSLIIPDASLIGTAPGQDGKGNYISSESNIFHHKGAIYLAAKAETDQAPRKRILWKTYDLGKTWINATHEEDAFIPNDIAACENSSFALTDNLYFVGYTTEKNRYDRDNAYLTTNTGYKIHLAKFVKGMGYTSVSADKDNIYVLFEGADDASNDKAAGGGILFRRFDYAGKEYANVNGRLFETGKDLRYIQNTLMYNTSSYIRGSYGDNDDLGAEVLLNYEKAKLGIFYKNTKDNSEEVYRTIPYEDETVSFTLGTDNILSEFTDWFDDSIYVGYQNSSVDFTNGSTGEANGMIGGYALKFKTPWFNYDLRGTGMYAKHEIQRNSNEGLNKTAEFDASVLSITNEIYKIYDIFPDNSLTVRPFLGVDSTYIKHDGFFEQNGNGFNDITVNSSSNWSHGGYIGFQAYGSYMLPKGMSLDYDAKVRYIHEFSDIDDWTDTYSIFGENFAFASPVNKNDYDNSIEGVASVRLNVNDRFAIGVAGKIDTATDNNAVFGQFNINF